MKIYGIASVKTECFGHGHYEDVETIRSDNIIDNKLNFPPFFTSREVAEEFILGLKYCDLCVVELELIDKEDKQ